MKERVGKRTWERKSYARHRWRGLENAQRPQLGEEWTAGWKTENSRKRGAQMTREAMEGGLPGMGSEGRQSPGGFCAEGQAEMKALALPCPAASFVRPPHGNEGRAWGQQRLPEPLLPPALPLSCSLVVNLGGQVGLLLAISKGQLRSICGDTSSGGHLSRGPDGRAAALIQPRPGLLLTWEAKAALNLSLNGALIPSLSHQGWAAGRTGAAARGGGAGTGASLPGKGGVCPCSPKCLSPLEQFSAWTACWTLLRA